jgi:hypothetical protein
MLNIRTGLSNLGRNNHLKETECDTYAIELGLANIRQGTQS